MIPAFTTTISIIEPQDGADPDFWVVSDDESDVVIEKNVRASIQAPSGREIFNAGKEGTVDFRLVADPCALTDTNIVVDDSTSVAYHVVWAEQRVGFGLDHTIAGLKKVTGLASNG